MASKCDVSETGKPQTGVLLLLLGVFSADGLPQYVLKEGENVTLQWRISSRTDLSLIDIICLFKPTVSPFRRVLDMVRGVEMIEQQDAQFLGRVHCDPEGLTRGQVQILLTGLRPQDSGNYECEMADPDMEVMSVDFVINVTTLSEPAVGDRNGLEHKDSNNQTDTTAPHLSNQNILTVVCVVVVITVMIMAFIIFKIYKLYSERRQRRPLYFLCAVETPACPSMGVDPSFSVVLPEVSPFPHGVF